MSRLQFGNFPGPQDPLSSLVFPGPRAAGATQPKPTPRPNEPLPSFGGTVNTGQMMPTVGSRQARSPFPQAPRASRNVPLAATSTQPRSAAGTTVNPFGGMTVKQPMPSIGIPGQAFTPTLPPPTGLPSQFLNWDQALANAMGADMANQQGAMNQLYGQMQGQIGQYEQALQQGLGTLQSVGVQQQQALQGIAGGLEQKGQQGYQEFKDFRDQQMGAVGQDITKANQFAAQATQNYQQAIADFKDTSAQDAANAAFGLRRDAMAQSQQIDMLDASPAEKAALKQTMMADVSSQVTQTVTGIYSNMNQTVASMQGNLSSLMGAQAQTAMAGGQLRGQVGTSFGAQTLQAQQMNQQMSELGANLRVMGEQAVASAMQQSVMLELQGRQTVAQMIQENPRQFVSMFAGMTGFLAAATTPGIGQISVPNFGAIR
jgi:hypothetical protein